MNVVRHRRKDLPPGFIVLRIGRRGENDELIEGETRWLDPIPLALYASWKPDFISAPERELELVSDSAAEPERT